VVTCSVARGRVSKNGKLERDGAGEVVLSKIYPYNHAESCKGKASFKHWFQ